ncbi:conserved hypothetical protein [Vibrio chagasii]|nr:conserved hypothetical protein [Vibrio chagasii]
MNNKIILVDPPWQYNDKSLNRGGAERHYPTMSMEELGDLNVLGLADATCALCMWATMPQLENAFNLIRQWGFVPVTTLFVWVKTYASGDPSNPFVGMGHYTRSNAEIMILAKPKGGRVPKRINASIRQVQYSPVTRHSAKPEKFRTLLTDLFGDLPRVELFARDKEDGWKSWGNEIENDFEVIAKPFNSVEESYLALTNGIKPLYNDLRAICPACFGHVKFEGVEVGDGGYFVLNCSKCGYTKSAESALLFKTSLVTLSREIQ